MSETTLTAISHPIFIGCAILLSLWLIAEIIVTISQNNAEKLRQLDEADARQEAQLNEIIRAHQRLVKAQRLAKAEKDAIKAWRREQ